MNEFLMGANALASAAIALFFLRFWQQTRDRLFLAFSLSFALLTASRTGLAAVQTAEDKSIFYWARLAAYLLILVAVIDKNRGAKDKQQSSPDQ